MTDLGTLNDLFRHMEWADALVWRCVLPADRLAEDAGIRERLFHIHLVQRAFLLFWREPSRPLPEPPAFSAAAALAAWGREYHREAAEYFKTIDLSAMDAPVSIAWADEVARPSGRPAVRATLAETMLQVTSHSSHHRGQINTRVRELGEAPPLTDFIAWVWLGKPPASWPGESAPVSRDEDAPSRR